MSYPWFRLYSELRTDPKMLRLTPAERWAWVGLLCLASESDERGVLQLAPGVPYEVSDLARALDVPEADVEGVLQKGATLKMLKVAEDGTISITNFTDRQYDKPSDHPEQTRRRKRAQRAQPEPSRADDDGRDTTSRECHADVTPCHATDTDTDTDTEVVVGDAHDATTTTAFKAILDRAGVSIGSRTQMEQWYSLLELTPDVTLIEQAFRECANQNKRASPSYIRSILVRCLAQNCNPGEWKGGKPEAPPPPPTAWRSELTGEVHHGESIGSGRAAKSGSGGGGYRLAAHRPGRHLRAT